MRVGRRSRFEESERFIVKDYTSRFNRFDGPEIAKIHALTPVPVVRPGISIRLVADAEFMTGQSRRKFLEKMLQGGSVSAAALIAGCTESRRPPDQGGGPERQSYRDAAMNPESYLYGDSGTELEVTGEIEIMDSEDGTVHLKVGENGEPISSPRGAHVAIHKVEHYGCGDSPGNLDIIDEYPMSNTFSKTPRSNGCVEETFGAAVVEIYEDTGDIFGDSYESKGYGLYVG